MSKHTILCVDDETSLLNSLQRLLRREPYKLLLAKSAAEGLRQLAAEPIHLVISDQRMPGTTGIQFLQQVKDLYPDTVRVILSGYADVGTIVEAINKGEVFRFLAKPWDNEHLRLAIRQCLEHYDLVRQNRQLLLQVQEQNAELSRMNLALDEMVNDRTRTLQIAQEILTILPIPVLGISKEGMVVLINEAFMRAFPNRHDCVLGNEINDALLPDELDPLQACLATARPMEAILPQVAGRPAMRLLIAPLKNSSTLAGCVAVWIGGMP